MPNNLTEMTEVLHKGSWAIVDEISKDGTVFLLDKEGETIETTQEDIDIILN